MQIFLVATSLKFQNFQLDLFNKHEVPLFIRRKVWFSFKKTSKKNFCLIISLFREFLCSFFIGKSETLFREVLTSISKNSFIHSFFPSQNFLSKEYIKMLWKTGFLVFDEQKGLRFGLRQSRWIGIIAKMVCVFGCS